MAKPLWRGFPTMAKPLRREAATPAKPLRREAPSMAESRAVRQYASRDQPNQETGARDDSMVLHDAAYLPGDRDLSYARARVLLWKVHLQGHRPGGGDRHAAGRRADRADWHHHLATPQGICVPDVSVRCRLRGWAAI